MWSRFGDPILDAQIGKSFEIPVGRQHDELVLSRQGRQHHVYLRQGASLAAQFDVDRAIQPDGPGIHGPQAHLAQQLR
jgi:hypothetical protein